MNKQQFLDIENPTPFEWATQQLIINGSKTNMEAVRRVFSHINQQLYKTNAKLLTFHQVYNAVILAASWLKDENMQYEKPTDVED